MKITNTTSTTRKIYRFPIPDSRFPIMVVSLRKHLPFIKSLAFVY
ncbi:MULTISPECIES: hypothetical protein [unclassified Moorena]|nr:MULTISPECIES: hypothetical protein [unclassified Moorena]